eukprot:g6003.t1
MAAAEGSACDSVFCQVEKHFVDVLWITCVVVACLIIARVLWKSWTRHRGRRKAFLARFYRTGVAERKVAPEADAGMAKGAAGATKSGAGDGGSSPTRNTATVPPSAPLAVGPHPMRVIADAERRMGPPAAGQTPGQAQVAAHADVRALALAPPAAGGRDAKAEAQAALALREEQPQLFVHSPTMPPAWRTHWPNPHEEGSAYNGEHCPVPGRVYHESAETRDAFSHPARPHVAGQWRLGSCSDSCSCESCDDGETAGDSSDGGGGGGEGEGKGEGKGKCGRASKGAAEGSGGDEGLAPCTEPPRRYTARGVAGHGRGRGRVAAYFHSATGERLVHPVELERRRRRRRQRARRERRAERDLEAAQREAREAPAKLAAARAAARADRRLARSLRSVEARVERGEAQLVADEAARVKWEERTAARRKDMEKRWGEMSFERRLKEEKAFDAAADAEREQRAAKAKAVAAALEQERARIEVRRGRALVAAARRERRFEAAAARRDARFAQLAVEWRARRAEARHLRLHGQPTDVFGRWRYWPHRHALRGAATRRERELLWVPMRAPQHGVGEGGGGAVFWYKRGTGETLSGPLMPQAAPCWEWRTDLTGHRFLLQPASGQARNALPRLAQEEAREERSRAAAAAAAGAAAASAGAASAWIGVRCALAAAWRAEEDEARGARRTAREAVLRGTLADALAELNEPGQEQILSFVTHLAAETPMATAAELMEGDMASLLVTGGVCGDEAEAGPACAKIEACASAWGQFEARAAAQDAEVRRLLRLLMDPTAGAVDDDERDGEESGGGTDGEHGDGAVATVVTPGSPGSSSSSPSPSPSPSSRRARARSAQIEKLRAAKRARARELECVRGERMWPALLARVQAEVLRGWDFGEEAWQSSSAALLSKLAPALVGPPWHHYGGRAEAALLCTRIEALLGELQRASAASRADEAAVCAEVRDVFEGLDELDADALEYVTVQVLAHRSATPAALEKAIGMRLIQCDFVGSHTLADEYCEVIVGEGCLIAEQAEGIARVRAGMEVRLRDEEAPLRAWLQSRRVEERARAADSAREREQEAEAAAAAAEAFADVAPSLAAAEAACAHATRARLAALRAGASVGHAAPPDHTFHLLTAAVSCTWPPYHAYGHPWLLRSELGAFWDAVKGWEELRPGYNPPPDVVRRGAPCVPLARLCGGGRAGAGGGAVEGEDECGGGGGGEPEGEGEAEGEGGGEGMGEGEGDTGPKVEAKNKDEDEEDEDEDDDEDGVEAAAAAELRRVATVVAVCGPELNRLLSPLLRPHAYVSPLVPYFDCAKAQPAA